MRAEAGRLLGILLLGALAWEVVGRIGDALRAVVSRAPRPPLERLGLGWLLGWPALGTAYLGLGAVGLFFPAPLIAAALALAGAARPGRRARPLLLGAARDPAAVPGAGGLLAALALAPVLLALATPEAGLDPMIYHLGVPWQMLQAHRVLLAAVPVAFHLPLPVELGYALPMALRVPGLTRAVTLSMFLGATAVIVSRRRAAGQAGTAWLVPVLVLSSYQFAGLLASSKNDVAAAALLVAGVLVHTPAAPALSAVLLGTSLAAKLTAVPWIACWWLFNLPARRRWPGVAAATLLPTLPWLAKSWIALGNPVFPVGTSLFATLNWDARNLAAQLRYVRPFQEPDTAFSLHLPLAYLKHLARVHPVAALALPALLWFGPARRAALACLVGGLGILGLGHDIRYLIPVAWLLLLHAVDAAARLAGRRGTAVRAGLAGYGVAAVVLLQVMPLRISPARLLETRAAALARILTSFDEVRMSPRLAGAGRIITLGDLRTWGWPARVVHGGMLGETPLVWKAVAESRDAAGIARRFRQAGARTVVYNYVTAVFVAQYYDAFPWTADMLRRYSAFVRTRLTEAWTPRQEDLVNGGYIVYRLERRPRATPDASALYLPGTEVTIITPIGLRNAGRVPEAVAALRRLAAQCPEVRFYRNEIAINQGMSGDWPAAYRTLKPLWDAGYRDLALTSNFSGAALFQGRLDEAAAACRAYLAQSGADTEAIRIRLAHVCYQQAQGLVAAGRSRPAEARLAEGLGALDFTPATADATARREWRQGRALLAGLRGELQLARGDHAAALASFQAASADGPDLAAAPAWRDRIASLSRRLPVLP